MHYLLTGDQFSAAEAFRIGQVQEVVEPEQQLTRAEEIAQTIAAQAPLGVRAKLASAQRGRDGSHATAGPRSLAIMQSKDVQECILSFIERRQANFKGR